jgi:hypothetical protein
MRLPSDRDSSRRRRQRVLQELVSHFLGNHEPIPSSYRRTDLRTRPRPCCPPPGEEDVRAEDSARRLTLSRFDLSHFVFECRDPRVNRTGAVSRAVRAVWVPQLIDVCSLEDRPHVLEGEVVQLFEKETASLLRNDRVPFAVVTRLQRYRQLAAAFVSAVLLEHGLSPPARTSCQLAVRGVPRQRAVARTSSRPAAVAYTHQFNGFPSSP